MGGPGNQKSLSDLLRLGGQEVEQVESFTYLGTVFDSQLSFAKHVKCVYKKAQQHLFLLRHLQGFNVR